MPATEMTFLEPAQLRRTKYVPGRTEQAVFIYFYLGISKTPSKGLYFLQYTLMSVTAHLTPKYS